jgi:hypothetical protein
VPSAVVVVVAVPLSVNPVVSEKSSNTRVTAAKVVSHSIMTDNTSTTAQSGRKRLRLTMNFPMSPSEILKYYAVTKQRMMDLACCENEAERVRVQRGV